MPNSSPQCPPHPAGIVDEARCRGLESLEPRLLLSAAAPVEVFDGSPALFVENQGQWGDQAVRYMHDGLGAKVAITDAGPIFQLLRQPAGGVMSLDGPLAHVNKGVHEDAAYESYTFSAGFVGANTVIPRGEDRADTRFNYFLGDAANWQSSVPAYEKVVYEQLYAGVDLHAWGQRDSLKYEFHIAPGADYEAIQVRYAGIEALAMDSDGALAVALGDGWGTLVDSSPFIYQDIDGEQVEVAGRFNLVDERTYSFEITGAYDPTRELIIDPDLAWGTYLGNGGWRGSQANDVAVDAEGNVVVVGSTSSSWWVSGGWRTGQIVDIEDAFLARFDAAGNHLWSTYLGGYGTDEGEGVAVGASGEIYAVGWGGSGWVSGGFDTTYGGGGDGFVVRLSPDGGHVWSSHIGGAQSDVATDVAVNVNGDIVVVGRTDLDDWVLDPKDTDATVNTDGFALGATSTGQLLWSTSFGGSAYDGADGVATDSEGNAIIYGVSSSEGWTSGGGHTTHNGGADAFLLKLDAAGSHLWSTYLDVNVESYAYDSEAVAVDSDDNILVAGGVSNFSWPANGWDSTHNGGTFDAFVTKLNSAGMTQWSTFFGGPTFEYATSIATDPFGDIVVSGWTDGYGLMEGGPDTEFGGDYDGFALKLSHAGEPIWSSYLGGQQYDAAWAIASDPAGNVVVAGQTDSPDWFSGGWDTDFSGSGDGFVVKIGNAPLNVGPLPDLSVSNADLVISPSGGDQRVRMYLWNLGEGDARDIPVRFRNADTGQVIGDAVIEELPAGTWDSADVIWQQPAQGSRVQAIVDPFDVIAESTNSNNTAEAMFSNNPAPLIANVRAEWDGDADAHAFGRFVSGVEAINTFSAEVIDAQGNSTVSSVTFTIDGLGSVTDSTWADGWTAAFDMGALDGDATLTVIAHDADGNASAPWQGLVRVVPFPSYLGDPDDDDVFEDGYYTLKDLPLGLDITHTTDPDWWIIGGTETSFRAGLQVEIVAGLNPDLNVAAGGDWVLEATVFDGEVYSGSWDALADDPRADVQFSFSPLLDGESLSLTGVSGELTADVSLSEFIHSQVDAKHLAHNPLDIKGPSHVVAVPIGPVPVPTTLSTGLRLDLAVDASLSIGFDAVEGVIQFLDDTYLQPTISAEPYLFGALGVPGLNVGLEVGGELAAFYRAEFDSVNGYEQFAWGAFQLLFTAVATLGRRIPLAVWSVPGDEPWSFGDVPPLGAGYPASPTDATTPDIHAWPDIIASKFGPVLLTRLVDVDPDPGVAETEIFYALRDEYGVWSPLIAGTSDGLAKANPEAAFDDLGGAVITWTGNAVDPALIGQLPYEQILDSQEIYWTYASETTIGAPQQLTSNSTMDGGAQIAMANGHGLVIWEHARASASTDTDALDIQYAVWNSATQAWGAAQNLTNDSFGDWAPTIAMQPNGHAMAVWLHDDDSDPTTAAIKYSMWDGSSWSAPAPAAIPSMQGVREPRLATDDFGNMALVWISNDGDADLLNSMIWDADAQAWLTAQIVDGTPHIVEGLDLAVSRGGHAMLIWHGWDGTHDLYASTRLLVSGADRWSTARPMTSSVDAERMASVTFDVSDNALQVWASDAATSIYGDGAAGLELDLLPDIDLSSLSIEADTLVDGVEAYLTATVSNAGWTSAFGPSVEFYDGDPDAGGQLINTASTDPFIEPGQSIVLTSDAFTLDSGLHEFFVVIAPQSGEVNTANNESSIVVSVAPPDTTPPTVTVALPAGATVIAPTSRMITLQFSEPVVDLSEADLSFVHSDDGLRVPDHLLLANQNMTAHLLFEGGLNAGSAAGSFTLRVSDTVADQAGNALDGNTDGRPGRDASFILPVALPGDTELDGDIDNDDLFRILGANKFNAGPSDATWSEGDFDDDGDVDNDDLFLVLGTNMFNGGTYASRGHVEEDPNTQRHSDLAAVPALTSSDDRTGARATSHPVDGRRRPHSPGMAPALLHLDPLALHTYWKMRVDQRIAPPAFTNNGGADGLDIGSIYDQPLELVDVALV